MWSVKPPRRIGTRLALLYALLFGLSAIVLGAVSIAMVDRVLRHKIDQRIAGETAVLTELRERDGDAALAKAIVQRMENSSTLHYRFETAGGTLIAGDLPATGLGPGWFDIDVVERTGQEELPDQYRAYAVNLGGGILTIADDTDDVEDLQSALTGVFAAAALLTVLLAIGGGLWLGRVSSRKLDVMAQTAEKIAAGDLTRTMPVAGTGDEFDVLSGALNHMLSRNAALLENQRYVANGIAHEIRTPLTRLRQTLEAGAAGQRPAALAQALDEADRLLDIFNALLRIAEIEEGARLASFKPINLCDIARKIADAYAASFEESGHHLSVACPYPVTVMADGDLLAQLLANIMDNILKHTPPGTTAAIAAEWRNDAAVLSVSDDGPGIPPGELDMIFRRFYRPELSRTVAGHGLGLAFARAVAELHGASLSATNRRPGLALTLAWPARQRESAG